MKEWRSQLGQMVCKDHEGTELGVATSRQVVKLVREIKSLALAKVAQAYSSVKRTEVTVNLEQAELDEEVDISS